MSFKRSIWEIKQTCDINLKSEINSRIFQLVDTIFFSITEKTPTCKYFEHNKEVRNRKQIYFKAGQILIVLHERVTVLDGERSARGNKNQN